MGAKSFMRKGFRIYEEMRKYLVLIYEEANFLPDSFLSDLYTFVPFVALPSPLFGPFSVSLTLLLYILDVRTLYT